MNYNGMAFDEGFVPISWTGLHRIVNQLLTVALPRESIPATSLNESTVEESALSWFQACGYTIDHGAALARLLTDDERQERLTSRDRNRSVGVYVTKARSACYADKTCDKTLGTLECFEAFACHAAQAAKAWIRRLGSIQEREVREIVERVPSTRITNIGKQFIMGLLNENQKRILQMDIL